jgi:hypothetical protein
LRTGAAEQWQHVAALIETGRLSKSNDLELTFNAWHHALARVEENVRLRQMWRGVKQIKILQVVSKTRQCTNGVANMIESIHFF